MNILVVDDEGSFGKLVGRVLSREGMSVTTTTRGAEAVALLEQTNPGLVIVDYMLKEERDGTWIEIEIHEGWNRQIRRMCEKVDLLVIRLRRVSVGPLVLGRLRAEMWRHLKGHEIQKLQKAAKGEK